VARNRIKKQKNRLLSITGNGGPIDLSKLIPEALRLCHTGMTRQKMKNFTLESIRVWGDRLHGSKDKESWDRVFEPGNRAWRGLSSVYDFVEHYGTGGGLCRPLFGEFLSEANEILNDSELGKLASAYVDLGRAWTELAHAALPDEVPAMREVKELLARKAELTAGGGSPAEIRDIWSNLDALERQARDRFPLSSADYQELRVALQKRVYAIYEQEQSACNALGRFADR
jgi:hypothetical protein